MKHKMTHTLIATALLGALGAAATPALAADSGFYLYGSAGQADTDRKAQVEATFTALGITAFTSSGDKHDTGYKLQAGWRFNRHIAIEGGYVDLGKYSFRAASTAPIVATRNGTLKIDGWNLGIAASAPLNEQFSLIAKAGVLNYSTEFHCTGTGVACANPDRSDSGAPLYYGVGAGWNFNPNWFLRAEYEVFTDVGTSFNTTGTTGTSKDDVKMGSVGVGYKF